MLLREIFIGGARAPPAPPHATALLKVLNAKRTSAVVDETFTGAALAKIQATAFKML